MTKKFVFSVFFSISLVVLYATGATGNEVSVRPSGSADAGPDIVTYVGTETEFKGIATSPDSMIVKYVWDFDGDGITDYESAHTGFTAHTFKQAGSYRAVFTAFVDSGAALEPSTISVEVLTGTGKQTAIPKDQTLRSSSLTAGQYVASAVTATADGYQQRYVVLINGPSETRYWDNARYAYDMFHTTYGISDKNIYFVNNNGKAPDGTNPNNIIDYVATKANLQTVFNTLAETVDADDIVIVWIVGHGNGYLGPVQRMSSQLSYYGYLGSPVSVDPGDAITAGVTEWIFGERIETTKALRKRTILAKRWSATSPTSISKRRGSSVITIFTSSGSLIIWRAI